MPRTASLAVIERKIKELEAKREALQQKEKPGIKQLKAVLVKYKLGKADVDAIFDKKKGGLGNGSSKLAGRKLKPKYRNPDNKQETWSGRGMQPKWMTAAMKDTGKSMEQFAI